MRARLRLDVGPGAARGQLFTQRVAVIGAVGKQHLVAPTPPSMSIAPRPVMT